MPNIDFSPGGLSPDLIERLNRDREHLHANPELSMHEHRTSEYLVSRLLEIGLDVHRVGDLGVVGVLANGEGAVIAHRADMDGLPVKEETGLPFASTATAQLNDAEVPVMHACGHDVHMAVALGAAARLKELTDHWSGTALFIFQPAEETAAGAKRMIDDGLWRKLPRPEVVLGLHVMPYEAGRAFVPVGTAMSIADSWRITVRGRGSHGSQPEKSIDPIVTAAAMILRLQTIVSREVGARESAVVTVGTFHAGLKENVIPDEAVFSVNVRSFDPGVRERVLAAIRRIVNAEAHAAAAPDPEIEVISEFPECVNDPEAARKTIEHLGRALGADRAIEAPAHDASEDFGYLGQVIDVPTVFWFLGGASPAELAGEEPVAVNHSPRFAPVAEPTLSSGVAGVTASVFCRFQA